MYGFVTEKVMEQSLNRGCIDPSWDVVTPTGSIIEDILSVLYIQLFFVFQTRQIARHLHYSYKKNEKILADYIKCN